jgi:uncharacterized protein (DUF934 family)
MRKILQQRELQPDPWRYPGEAAEVADARPQLLTLAEAVAQGEALAPGSGVLLAPGEEHAALLPLLPKLALVVLRFEKPGEGRGFSVAQMLRQQAGYRGTLRAAGPVIKRDQLYLLARCGFDAFELGEGEDPVAALAHLAPFSVAYQPATDGLVHPRQRA